MGGKDQGLSMAKVFQKNINDKALILSPRESMVRKMALPTGWNNIRIGLGLSCVSNSGDDTEPIAESVARHSYYDDFFFGIKTDGATHPWESGVNFIGISSSSNNWGYPTAMQKDSGYWILGNGANSIFHLSPTIGNNGTISRKTPVDNRGISELSCGLSSSASNYAAFVWVNLAISGTSLTTSGGGAGVNTPIGTADFSDFAFNQSLNEVCKPNSTETQSTGAFWSSGSTPAVTSIYLRNQFYNNRLRIHTYGYLVVS